MSAVFFLVGGGKIKIRIQEFGDEKEILQISHSCEYRGVKVPNEDAEMEYKADYEAVVRIA